MKTFTIDNETNNWSVARLIEIWTSLPGETPVKKFKDRATAVSRIWKAIQNLGQVAPAAEDPAAAPIAERPETAPVPAHEAAESVDAR